MTARDVNIAYLKRLKTSYELRAKELELQAALYRQDAFNPFPLPHSRHFHGRGPPAVRMTSGFEDDDCPCTADIGYNTMCSFRDEGRSTVKIVQPDPRDATNESSTSLDLDLATLSVIRQLATREKETKKRIARLDTVEAAIMSLIKENPPPPKNDQQETAECKGKLKLDSEIQLDVARMKEVADHLALKVKETVNTVQKEFSAHEAANLVTCQPACPDAELASNLQESVQCVSEEMSDITSTDKIIPELGNEAETTAEDAPVEETGCAEKTAEPATADEPDKGNDKMEIMKRNVSIVVDHLKVCDECPVKEFENINQDLESILEIFQNIHDETSHPKQSEALDARYTTYNVAAERREDAVTEQDESAMETIDDIIARATKVVCETIIKETEVSLKTMRRSLDEEHPLINVENVPPTSDIGTNLAEHGNEIQQPSASLNKEHTSPNVEDIPPKTKMDTESAESENVTQQESPVESSNAQHKLFNCCSACLCLTENTEAAQPMLLAEHGMDKLPEEVPQAEVTLVEPEPAFDDAAEEVPPAESTADDLEPALDDAAEEVPPAEVTLVEPGPAFDDAAEEVPPAESTADDPGPAFDDAAEEVPPAEVTLVEPEPAFDDAAEEVPPAEGTPTQPVRKVLAKVLAKRVGESVGCQTAITFTGRCKVKVTTICVSSVAACATVAKDKEAEGTPMEPDPAVDDAPEEVPPAEGTPTQPVPMVGESVGCQTAITFTGRCKVNVTTIRVSAVAACATVAKDVDERENTCKCKSQEREEITVLTEDDEEKPFAITESVESVTETSVSKSVEDMAENESTADASPIKSAVEVPLAEIAAEPPPAEVAVEQIPQEPSAEESKELAAVEPSPDLAPVESLKDAAVLESASKHSLEEPVTLPAPIETVVEQVPDVQEVAEELSSKPSDTAASPADVQSPSKVVSSKSVVRSPDPTRSPGKIPSSEKPRKPSDPAKSPAKTASTPIAVNTSKEKSPVRGVSSTIAAETSKEKSPVKGVSSPIVVKTPKEKSPVRGVSSTIAAKTSREKSPVKGVSSPIVVKTPKEKSPVKGVSSPIVVKTPSEKSPVKCVSSPIAVKTSREKSSVKGVSSPIVVKTPREKIPVKGVSSPIVVKTQREKSPVKSTTSPIAIKPNKDNIPRKSGSTSSAEKPADQKTSAAKHPSTPSTKVHRRSIGSVGSRSSAKSASSKKSDVQQKRGCACNRRQESSCKKRGANNGFAPGMCPSSPQRKCFCRKPSSRRESPSKGRGAKGVNVDAPAEAPLITVNRKCFCAQWAIYRENHFKCRGPKDEKDQQKPPVAKNCKCTHKKLK